RRRGRVLWLLARGRRGGALGVQRRGDRGRAARGGATAGATAVERGAATQPGGLTARGGRGSRPCAKRRTRYANLRTATYRSPGEPDRLAPDADQAAQNPRRALRARDLRAPPQRRPRSAGRNRAPDGRRGPLRAGKAAPGKG